jgi:predicted site-specific integrase-resolvase
MNEKQEYITIKEASKIFGITSQSLRNWESKGKIKSQRTPTNLRVYRVSDIKQALGIINDKGILDEKRKILYCRVSSSKQVNDLNRQIESLKLLYPTYDVITDVASGINFRRKGLQTILEYAMSKQLEEVVVAHKDRLCRFGFELIEYIISTNGAKLTILDNKSNKSDNEELADDIIAIIHVFSCKQMGRRRYSAKKLESTNISN